MGSFRNTSQSNTSNTWTVDRIIQKVFPIVGITMMVGGLGYFFYDGFWGNISMHGRLGIGFFIGLALILGGYSFSSKLKSFADIVIGGGILALYATLIYGSRFEFANQLSIFPESIALITSAIFCGAIAFYSAQRQSKTILMLGMIGAYLTPFFIGQIGAFEYQTSFTGFLIYFLAISVSLFTASFRMNLIPLMTANMVGLFLGTLSLSGLMTVDGFAQNPILSALISFSIVVAHLGFVTLNTKKFAGQNIISGIHFIAPFLWLVTVLAGAIESQYITLIGELSLTGVLMVALSVGYFAIWNYLSNNKDLASDLYTSIYIMGFVSGAVAFMDIAPLFGSIAGLIISGILILFALLFGYSKKPIREVAFLSTATLGATLTTLDAQSIHGSIGIIQYASILISLALAPFLLHFVLPTTSKKIFDLRKTLAWFSAVLIFLFLGLDIIEDIHLPFDFIFFTVPALLVALYLFFKKSNFPTSQTIAHISLGLLALGYFQTFFIFWDKIFPAHQDTFLGTEESLIGLLSLITSGLLLYWIKKNTAQISSGTHFLFLSTFIIILFQLVSHELIGLYNIFFPYNFDITSDVQGIRSLATSFWWVLLSAILILLSIRNIKKYPHEKKIGIALMAITFGKIFLYDLSSIDTNLKVLLFVITGGVLLSISYFSHVKK